MDRIVTRLRPALHLSSGKPHRLTTLPSWACQETPRTPSTTTSVMQTSPFSASPNHQARRPKEKKDRRITLIRYFLQHPSNPRPLRFSRLRALRHWTIHRAWQLHKLKQHQAHQLELERQWRCMRMACEELRLIGEDGCTIKEGGSGQNMGAHFRSNYARERTRAVPIEYARALTDWPSRDGWNHDWTRA